MSIDIEITLIKEFPAILCYLYSDAQLLDAISITNLPVTATIPYSAIHVLLIAKELLTGKMLFEEVISVRKLLSKSLIIPENSPILLIQACTNTESSINKSLSEPASQISMDDLLAVEKLRQQELELLKETKIFDVDTVNNKFSDIRESIARNLEERKQGQYEKNKELKDTTFRKLAEFKRQSSLKEKGFTTIKESMHQEIFNRHFLTEKLKADNDLMRLELDSVKNEIKFNRLKSEKPIDMDLTLKKYTLAIVLENINRELINKKSLQLVIQNELNSLKKSNNMLQDCLLSLTQVSILPKFYPEQSNKTNRKISTEAANFSCGKSRKSQSIDSNYSKNTIQ